MEEKRHETPAGADSNPANTAANGNENSNSMRRMEERSPESGKKSLAPKEITATPDEFEQMKLAQRMPLAIVAGLLAGAVCAALWAVITVALNMQIGYMAVAVGAGVGFAVRFAGRGVTPAFGIVGAAISLVSCLAGNFFSVISVLASQEGVPVMEALSMFDYAYLPELMGETFHAMDLLFYALAIYEGFRFGFKKVNVQTGADPVLR